jgi:hypothetical protein
MNLKGALTPQMWDSLVGILQQRDPYLLTLLTEKRDLSPAQRSILDDILAGEVIAALDNDWRSTDESDRLEALLVTVMSFVRDAPPPTPWPKDAPPPFDRYEEYGEVRPPEHPPRPLRPGGAYVPEVVQPFDPVSPPTRLGGYSVEVLDRMEELRLTTRELEQTFYNPVRICVPDPAREVWVIADNSLRLEVDRERMVKRVERVD